MRFISFLQGNAIGLGVQGGDGQFRGLLDSDPAYPGSLDALIRKGPSALSRAGAILSKGAAVDFGQVKFLPPLIRSPKIICIGLNYANHISESGIKAPEYPTVFARFASSLIGHGAPIIRPRVSTQLDYEGELVAVIGKTGRHISKEDALDYVAGYALFNDATIRDYQFKSPQWTVGKNFDGTGAFGPEFITADELPPGAKGLMLRTRLNGVVVQEASIDDMIFDVATLVATLSEAFTLEAGDVIVTGTPSGVGLARKPPLWMRPDDICEVEVDGFMTLSNPIKDDGASEKLQAA